MRVFFSIVALLMGIIASGYIIFSTLGKLDDATPISIGEIIAEGEDVEYYLSGLSNKTITITADYKDGKSKEFKYPSNYRKDIDFKEIDYTINIVGSGMRTGIVYIDFKPKMKKKDVE